MDNDQQPAGSSSLNTSILPDLPTLRVGYEEEDLTGIKSQWIRYNHDISKSVKCMTADKRKGAYKSVCACAPNKNGTEWRENAICKAHIFIYKNKVTSVNLEHTCSAEDPGRKRQYSVALMTLASEEIRDYTGPTRDRGTSVQQYAENARAAGFQMGRTQAYKVLQRINQDPIETHIGQYFLLTKIFKGWKRSDSGGAYELDTTDASWNDDLEAFQRCYIAPSFSKHAWKHSKMKFLTLNASFITGGHFSHTILLAVTYDANNEAVLLAFALCDQESGENWIWFLQNLMRDFPGIQILLSSSKQAMDNPEFRNLLQLISAHCSQCIQSLIDDCPEKVSKDDWALVERLGKAPTFQLFNVYLQALQKRNPEVAIWLDARKDQFASHLFLEAGKTRFGRVVDGVAEDPCLKEIIESVQDLPIATLLVTLLTKLAILQTERKHRAEQHGEPLSDYISQHYEKTLLDASKHHVQPTYNKDGIWKAYVSYDKEDVPLYRILVTVNTDTYQMQCPCEWSQNLGYPCVHCSAFFLKKNLYSKDVRWFHARYLTSTLISMYDAPTLPGFYSAGKLAVVELAPPQQRGERTKKRRAYTPTSNPDTARVCRACGEKGHHHKTCHNPSTQYQFERFSVQAKKWADAQNDVKPMNV
jgi:hypothetical protein